jgi:hypothetical protein
VLFDFGLEIVVRNFKCIRHLVPSIAAGYRGFARLVFCTAFNEI